MQRRFFMLLVLTSFVAITGITGISGVGRAFAQDANLLHDGGMEGEYSNRGRADLNIPVEWSLWFSETPRNETWMNLPPVAFPHNGPDPNPHSGARALNLNKNFATFTAAIYQQVSVADGAAVTASAFAFLRTCDIPQGADRCTSSPDSGAFTKIGIDPNGGTNPLDTDVVWSGNQSPHELWGQMTVSTTATGGTVTLFLYTTQTWPRAINQVYWDDAFLSAGTDGVAPVAPTPPQEVGFVQPQNQRTDGSIVHVVQAGDTIDSIAVAYGMTRDQVLALNPTILSPRFIQIGQEIIIRPPQTPTSMPTPTMDTALPTVEPDLLTSIAQVAVSASTPGTPSSSEIAAVPSVEATVAETIAPTETIPTVEPTMPPTEAQALEPSPTLPSPTNPAAAVVSAPPAPVISAANGVVYPINPADESASICVLMFEDTNQNRLQDADEGLVSGGTITLSLNGAQVAQHITGDLDPTCIDGLTSAEYLAVAQPPDGYGLTTADQLHVRTTGGAQIAVSFGAAPGISPVTLPPPDFGSTVTSTGAENAAPQGISLRDNLGLIVLGGAAFVLVFGMGASLLLRRR